MLKICCTLMCIPLGMLFDHPGICPPCQSEGRNPDFTWEHEWMEFTFHPQWKGYTEDNASEHKEQIINVESESQWGNTYRPSGLLGGDSKTFTLSGCLIEFYVHGTMHLSNTSHINTNEMQLFFSFIWSSNSTCFGRSLHPSSGVL